MNWPKIGVELKSPEQMIISIKHPDHTEETTVFDIFEKRVSKSIQLNHTVHLCQPLVLKSVYESFRMINNRVQHLEIVFDMMPNKDEQNCCLTEREYVKRAIQVLCTGIGEQFESLTIRDAKIITFELLDDLAPMLRRIKTLDLITESNASLLFALHEYCPNLIDLLFVSEQSNGEYFDVTPQHWPTILEVVLRIGIDMNGETKIRKQFQRFIELNPQIKFLQFDTIIDVDLFKTITKNCSNITALSIARETFADIGLFLDLVSKLEQLKSIKLSILLVQKTELNSILVCAERFHQMKQLKLIVLFQNLVSNDDQCVEHTRLFSCSIKQHEHCECHGEERFLELMDINQMVKLPKNRPILVTYFNTMDLGLADMSLMMPPFATFEETKKFFPNVIDNILIDTNDSCHFIHISYA